MEAFCVECRTALPAVNTGRSVAVRRVDHTEHLRWDVRRIANFRARTTRAEYWAAVGFVYGGGFALLLVTLSIVTAMGIGDTDTGLLLALGPVAVILLPVFWGATVNRLHDIGRPWYYALLHLIPLPFASIIVLIWLGSAESEPGPNPWGAPVH